MPVATLTAGALINRRVMSPARCRGTREQGDRRIKRQDAGGSGKRNPGKLPKDLGEMAGTRRFAYWGTATDGRPTRGGCNEEGDMIPEVYGGMEGGHAGPPLRLVRVSGRVFGTRRFAYGEAPTFSTVKRPMNG